MQIECLGWGINLLFDYTPIDNLSRSDYVRMSTDRFEIVESQSEARNRHALSKDQLSMNCQKLDFRY